MQEHKEGSVKVVLGGREFFAAPLPLKIFRTKADWFQNLNLLQRGIVTPEVEEAVVGIIHASLVRNHPGLTTDEVEDELDLLNMQRTIETIMNASGAQMRKPGEVPPGEATGPGNLDGATSTDL